MLGRNPTDQELQTMLGGGTVSVDSMPTLESRKYASELAQQNMERVAKYDSIADSLLLDRDKFSEVQEANDRNWSITTGQIAEQFEGIEQAAFSEAQYMLDGMNNNLFFDETLSPEEKIAKQKANLDIIAAKFFPGKEHIFREASSLFNRTIGNQQAEQARGLGIDAETFADAQRQIQQSEDRMLDIWGSLLSGAKEDAVGFNINETAFPDQTRAKIKGILTTLTNFGSTAPDPENQALDFVQNGSSAEVNSIRNQLLVMFPQRIFSDTQLASTLASALRHVDTGGGNAFTVTSNSRDWFKDLSAEEKTSIMSLIGGQAGGSTERESSGLLGSIGRLVGVTGAAIAGTALSGGNPAVGAAAASAVAGA